MPLLTADTVSFPEFSDLARRVALGDGLGWQGDDRLFLMIEVLEHRGRRGHRLAVYRHCEDGTDQVVGRWHPGEQYRVLSDLALMRAGAPGVASVCDRIDKHNAAKERDAWDAYNDKLGEALDHMTRFYNDTTGPRTRFYMNDIKRKA